MPLRHRCIRDRLAFWSQLQRPLCLARWKCVSPNSPCERKA